MESNRRIARIHKHPLNYRGYKSFWICNGRFAQGCKSNGEDNQAWRCSKCDFDLCNTCMKFYMVEIKEINEQQMKDGNQLQTNIHKHPLNKLYRPKACCDLCRRNSNNQIFMTCIACDFDICLNCCDTYHKEKIIINQVVQDQDSIDVSKCLLSLCSSKSPVEEIQALKTEFEEGENEHLNNLLEETASTLFEKAFSFIPYANLAFSALKMIFGSDDKQKKIEEAKRKAELEFRQRMQLVQIIMNEVDRKFYQYDYYKTQQEFQANIEGVMNELSTMAKKSPNTDLWKQKAQILETTFNMLYPKFSTNLYPHKMLTLKLAATISPIHLSLIHEIIKYHPQVGFNQDDINDLTDKYIVQLRNLIIEATKYRIEKLFGYQQANEKEDGGFFYHFLDQTWGNYDLYFYDQFTGTDATYENVSADVPANFEDKIQNIQDIVSYLASYYMGSFLQQTFEKGDQIQRAIQILMTFQNQRNQKVTGTLQINWKRIQLKCNPKLIEGKILIEKVDLIEGPCQFLYPPFMILPE